MDNDQKNSETLDVLPDVPTEIKKTRRERLFEIDRAKGLFIPLVVLSHITLRGHPADNEWYYWVNLMITSFDMPLFMYLSGILMFYSGAAYSTKEKYIDLVKKRFNRFMIPYTLMGLFILFGKIIAAHFIFVDNKPESIFHGISSLFWHTHTSPASSLWYIFCIFIFCVTIPPLVWLTRGKLWPLLFLGAVLYPLQLPGYLFLDKIATFFVFFMMGGITTLFLPRYQAFIDKWSTVSIVLFIASFSLLLLDLHWKISMGIIGVLSLPAIHSLVRRPKFRDSALLLSLGTFCYVIYLFNTINIGITKGIMLHFISWDGPNFLIFVPILLSAGLIGPIIMKALIFKRIKFLDKMTS